MHISQSVSTTYFYLAKDLISQHKRPWKIENWHQGATKEALITKAKRSYSASAALLFHTKD